MGGAAAGGDRRWRALLALAVGRPAFEELLDPERLRPVWVLARAMALLAALFDLGLWLALRGAPEVRTAALDAFVAVNLPGLALAYAVGAWSTGRAVGRAPIVAFLILAHLTVVVWIQATGSLSSYFLMAATLSVAAHRALLSWSLGALSLGLLIGLHLAAFVLEEVGVLTRVPLFVAEPGPVYGTAAFRVAVMASIVGVYVAAWMGTNVLVATLRRTQRALDAAERRLAAAAAGVQTGRLSGQVVAGYRLGEVLGRGGMAEVYRGVAVAPADDAAAAPVAVKVMHPHLVDDEALVARLRREARLAARLPATVTAAVRSVHLAGPGERAVVLELLRGEDLAARLRRVGHLPLVEGVTLLLELARAVAVIHRAGIVHRDLKPHNVFVLDDGSPRVLDFGVAAATDEATLTATAVVVGTLGYLAPEVAAGGAAEAGPEVDVYALGVIASQVLTGARPDERTDDAGRVAPPAALAALVARATAREPAQRYPDADAFAAALTRWLERAAGPDPLEDTAVLAPG